MIFPVANSVLGICGQPQGFYLYNTRSGEVVAEIAPELRELSLDSLGLSAGDHSLELRYVDEWGVESDAEEAVALITVGAGGEAITQLTPASNLVARAIAGGLIELEFHAIARAGYDVPAEYEVRDSLNAATSIDAIAADGRSFYLLQLGPFASGTTVQIELRASDGEVDGFRGAWVSATPVIVDGTAPGTVSQIAPVPRCCCN